MKKISFWWVILALMVFTSGPARAQDAATQQQLDKLSGQIQDLLDAQALQGKRLDALEKEVSDLGNKVNQPAAGDGASADDLKKLAEQVQEIDKKRQDDNELILKQIANLAKIGGGSPRHSVPAAADNPPAPAPGTKQKGYDYEVQAGNTLSGISKAYRDQGVKVSVAQILAANPGLTPKNMKVGQKIFIPDPNAK